MEYYYSGVLEREDLCFVCQYFAITLLSSVNNKRKKKLSVCLSSCKAAENWDITSVVCSTYRSSEDIPSIFTRNMCKTLPKELMSTHDDSCIVLVHVIPYTLKGEKKNDLIKGKDIISNSHDVNENYVTAISKKWTSSIISIFINSKTFKRENEHFFMKVLVKLGIFMYFVKDTCRI